MRKRLFEVIEIAGIDDKVSNIYDSFMMCAIIASLIPLCTKSTAAWTVVIDTVTVSIFIIDYTLRLITADFKFPGNKIKAFIRYPFSAMAVIDLLSIMPSFAGTNPAFKVFRVFRLFRTLKVLKALRALKAFRALRIVRYSKSMGIIASVIRNQKEALMSVGTLAAGYIFVAALVIFNVEPDSFDNFFSAIYWACVSLTTVGYGDIYPVSTAGRVVTMLSSIVGIAIVALPAGIITAGYMEEVGKDSE